MLGQAVTPKKKAKLSQAKPTCDEEAEEGLIKRIFKYVNNSAQSDATVERADFRDMLQFAIDNATKLQSYKHMGRERMTTIQFATFDELLTKVKNLLQSVRDWQMENMVRNNWLR